MGLNYTTCDLIIDTNLFSKIKSVTGSANVLTLGRQSVRMSSKQKKKLATRVGLSYREIDLAILNNNGYCEDLLALMGADEVQSLDYSDYEGADYIANLNENLFKSKELNLSGKFDVVFDFGTTQMIFNPIQSIVNSLSFLKVDGVLVLVLPVSGFINHGMYQFGPHFFTSISHKPYLNVSTCYFERTRSAKRTKVWKSINPFFDFNHKYLMTFSLIQKVSDFSHQNFIEDTQMVKYAKVSSDLDVNSSTSNKRSSVNEFKKSLLKLLKKTPIIRNVVSLILSRLEAKSLTDVKEFNGL